MKKTSFKAAILPLLILAISLSGCGKKEDPEPTPEPTERPVEQVIVDTNDGDVEIVNILEVPKEDWPSLTWEQVRDFTEKFLPGFRETYKIPEDKELTESDWEELKGIMFWQLFGQIYEQYIAVGDVYADVEVVEEVEGEGYGEDWIYFEPTKEYLESLGPNEIAEYFQNFYPKVFGATPTIPNGVDEDGNAIETPIVWRDLTDEQLMEAMQVFIKEQFK